MVSEIGEQWSPKIAPASTLPTAPSMRGWDIDTGAPPETLVSISYITTTTNGVKIAIVPQLVPVAKAIKPATTKTSVGIVAGETSDW